MGRSVLLVDGNNLLHRVLRVPSIADLKTSTGKNFGGVYGFLKCLRNTLDSQMFRKCVVVWDAGKSERRLKILPEYKAGRVLGKDENEAKLFLENFKLQRHYLSSLFPKLGISELSVPGKEADDVIWFVRALVNEGTLVVSEDRDFYQMVDGTTDLFRPIQEIYVTESTFEEVVGIPKVRFLMYKSIIGDSGDNVAGIKGVGDVTAKEIVLKIHSIDYWDDIVEWCANHKNKRVKSVAENIDTVKRNYELIKLGEETFTESEVKLMRDGLNQGSQSLDEVRSYFKVMEFTSLINTFHQWSIPFRRLV